MNDVEISDLHRIIFGNAPAEFMIEVLIRAIIIFSILVIVVKWLGKRMSGQLTITELGIMIMLGAIVAPPMESPDKGILLGVMILLLILFYHRSLTFWGVKNSKIETITQGRLSILIKDGIIQLDEARKTGVTHAQLYAVLRKKKIYNLGKVNRLYLEACGLFSVFEAEETKPGLSLLPVSDDSIHQIQQYPANDLMSCINCGNTKRIKQEHETCDKCNDTNWDKAVINS